MVSKLLSGRYFLLASYLALAAVTSALLVGPATKPAAAQTALPARSVANRPARGTASYQTLYVDSAMGSDSDSGLDSQPLQTITRALEIASPNTVIVLSPGRYTRESGEIFPLQMKSGVTIQGRPGSSDRAAIIEGGGNFTSPTRSQQNATIIAADRAGIAQVAISNPDGYGIWVESTSPTILETALVGNRQTGIYVASGSPRVQGSYFSGNQVAGLIVFGVSNANIQHNTFDGTGDAIRVLDGATPEIIGNRITNNEAGVVLIGNAQPVIRDNQIVGNRQNEVVEVATQLRSVGAPVGFAEENAIDKEPGELLTGRIEPIVAEPVVTEPIDVEPVAVEPATIEPIAVEPVAPVAVEPVAVEPVAIEAIAINPLAAIEPPAVEPIAAEPVAVEPVAVEPVAVEPIAVEPIAAEPVAVEPVAVEPVAIEPVPELVSLRSTLVRPVSMQPAPVQPIEEEMANSEAVDIAVISSEEIPAGAPGSALQALQSGLALAPRAVTGDNTDSPGSILRNRRSRPTESEDNNSIESPEPAIQPSPIINNNRLAVPNSSIPIGSGASSTIFSPPNGGGAGAPPAPPSRAQALGLYYRVFVEADDPFEQDSVREVVPDAFRTRFEGQAVMQVGAFPTEEEAEERRRLLADRNFEVRVEYIR